LWKANPSLLSWRDALITSQLLGQERSDRAFELAGLQWFAPYVRNSLEAIVTGSVSHLSGAQQAPRLRQLQLRLLGWEGASLLARHPIGWAVRLPPAHAILFLAGSAVPSRWYARQKHTGYLAYWTKSLKTIWSAAAGTDFRVHDLHDET